MESIEGKHSAPWEKEEERIIKSIDTKDEIIDFPGKKTEGVTPQEKIWALQAEIERLGGVNVKEAEKLQEILKKEKNKLDKERFKAMEKWKTFKKAN
ncbi:MAG: hypothetical protein ABIJ28_03345 [Patescibacteria group bacterium]